MEHLIGFIAVGDTALLQGDIHAKKTNFGVFTENIVSQP